MNNDKKTILIIIAILVIAIFSVLAFALLKENKKVTDGAKFKEEYTKYNGTINEKNSKLYPTVELDDGNVFKYKTETEIIKILNGGNGIIYFGYPTCPWCRNAVNILNKAAINTGIGEVLYLNIEQMRSILELDENDNVITKKAGSEAYKKILEALDDVLEPYYLSTKSEEQVDTKEKRLYAPTVITVQNGKVKEIHVGTVDSQKDAYTMTKEEQVELFEIYTTMFKAYADSGCDEAC